MSAHAIQFFKELGPKLGKRKCTFMAMIHHLSKIKNPLIIETGSAREANSFSGDGLSTYIFDQYCQKAGGKVISIDICQKACNFSRSITNPSITRVIQEDSVKALWSMQESADLLYLDSYDLSLRNPFNSAFHHMKEFIAAQQLLKEGTLIVVDDNYKEVGKGMFIREFFYQVGIKPLFDNYQVGWLWPKKETMNPIENLSLV